MLELNKVKIGDQLYFRTPSGWRAFESEEAYEEWKKSEERNEVALEWA